MTSRAVLSLCLALLGTSTAFAQSTASHKGHRARRSLPRIVEAPRPGPALAFPLRHTRVDADIQGFVASVIVEQTFDNPYERAIEARFNFPIPDGAAVDSMTFLSARGNVNARIGAGGELEFQDPSSRTARLDQLSPDLLRLVLDSIAPHEEVRVVTRYHYVLEEVDGQLVFELPLVAESHYTPSVGEQASLMREDERRPDRVELSIHADFGRPVLDVTSPTHDVVADHVEDRAVVQLATFATPDADVEVRFTLGGARPPIWAAASAPGPDHEGFAALSIVPSLTTDQPRRAHEVVFVIDASASMEGTPIALAREITRRALQDAHPDDRFHVLRFCDGVERLSEGALAPDQDGLARADAFLDGTRAFGPSEMDEGLVAALSLESDPERERMVVLLSDGFVGDEASLLREIAGQLEEDERLFTIGVGSATHRYLLRHLAELGAGQARFVAPLDPPGAAASRLLADLDRPLLSELRIDWGGLQVNEAARLPSRSAGQPIVVHARYARGGRGRIVLRGMLDGTPFSQPIELALPAAGEASPRIMSTFLRARIQDDERSITLLDDDRTARRITDRAFLGSLLSPYTSLVATDADTATDLSRRLEVEQPHDRPAGS